jgi:hypothetical protein
MLVSSIATNSKQKQIRDEHDESQALQHESITNRYTSDSELCVAKYLHIRDSYSGALVSYLCPENFQTGSDPLVSVYQGNLT